ncbi:hypothetical protein Droror1_Dr00015796 [Drosera rotundifolia]
MTIDDENSIYVGGLPYDCSEDELRRVFELYGAVVAVKIINDRGVGGKCYGFVTFTNPRSAIDAISDMNGRPIRGRAVKVNEVKSRTAAGRLSHGREGFRRGDRDMVRNRRRDRDNNYDNRRDQFRDHAREHEHESEREFHDHGGRRSRDNFHERDHDEERDLKESERGRSRNRDREWGSDTDRDIDRDMRADIVDDHDGRGDEEKDSCRRSRSRSFDGHSRELSSDSSDYQQDLGEEIRSLTQRREELNGEKLYLEESLEEKKQLLMDLQQKTKKLEEALTSSKKLSSLRQMQLVRLQRSFLLVKECGERLKSSEKDLQALAESLMAEINGDDMVA